MKRLIIRNRIVSGVLIIIVAFLIYFLTYAPVKEELRTSTVYNFYYIADAKYDTIENLVNKNIESTMSMSSRSAIRTKIVEYLNGNIAYSELETYTVPKYVDGYEVLDSAIQAIRIVDGKVLCSIGADIMNAETVIHNIESMTNLNYSVNNDGSYEMVVYSPIFQETEVIGYDMILYSLRTGIEIISQEDYEISLVDYKRSMDIPYEMLIDDYVFEDDNNIVYRKSLSEDTCLCIKINKSILFEEVDKSANRNAIVFLFLVAFMLVSINILIIRFAHDLLKRTSEQSETYKNKLKYDTLTNAYSREILEVLKERYEIFREDRCIIMIDVNDFKSINDSYGHPAGDEVLIYLSNYLKTRLREDDYVIRYGGDEFLLILGGISLESANSLMINILRDINNKSNLFVEFSFSYGISSLNEVTNLEEAIKKADDRLYFHKKNKNSEKN